MPRIQSLGNHSTAIWLQAKLRVSTPDDRHEREADRVADHVMRMPEPVVQRRCSGCAAGHACTECGAGEPGIQRTPLTAAAPPSGSHPIVGSLGAGASLDRDARAYFEPRFGRDFGSVRVHTGAAAARSAHAVHARAYAVGRDIVFGAGEYAPATVQGRRLLAHELTHVVQQGGEVHRRAYGPPPAASGGPTSLGTPAPTHAPVSLARAPLDVGDIAQDIQDGVRTHPDLFSWLHVMGDRSGEIGHGADRPAGRGPDPAPVPTDPTLPIDAHFFPSFVRHHGRRALVIGGIHGNEHPGFEVADALVAELASGTGLAARELHFHTLVIPRINPGGIADDSRCNRQLVDLNRNFPVPGVRNPGSPVCRNTARAPVQPETQALIDVINAFRPQRIVSLHSIGSPAQAGIFADPTTDTAAKDLACSMARLVVDPSNRRGNRLTATRCDAGYGGGATGGTSLGAFAPTRSIPGQTVPVITMEAPRHGPLGTGVRTTEAFLRPLRGFLTDPALLADRVDLNIVRDIEALTLARRRLFLTGRVPATDDLIRRVGERVDQRVAELNALRPTSLPAIRVVSHHRGFETSATGSGTRARGQAHIVFEKFTLTGGHRTGWDTLPDRYFRGGSRSRGVDRDAWLHESSATRLNIILRFSAVPGASRHHWGTDVDFNSTTVADWEPAPTGGGRAGRFNALGTWLQANAARAGFVQAYTPGRSGGHHEEAWHYSYAPIALRLRELHRSDVRTTEDVVDPMLDFFTRRARAQRITLPSDLTTALAALNVDEYVHTIGPGL